MKVYLLYKSFFDGCDASDDVEYIYTNKDKAEWDCMELQETHGDDYISYYVEEYTVDETKLGDLA